MIDLKLRSALIIVDMQNDFMPDGALPIPDADKIVTTINKYIDLFSSRKSDIFATRDWHPKDHLSFKEYGGRWPTHCVRDTKGAEFKSDLKLKNAIIISKATEKDKEAYSGFDGTELLRLLRERNVKQVFITGVATDYCVKHTALDALKYGFNTIVLKDAVRGINEEDALKEMERKGIIIAVMKDIE